MVVVPVIPTQLLTKLGDGLKLAAVDEIGFERVKERLHVGVLPRRSTARHALPNPVRAQAIPQRRAEKLTAAVGVKDEPRGGMAPPDGRVDHGARQPRVAHRAQSPRQEATRILIHDRREVPPPAGDREIREVTDPDLVRAAGPRPADLIRVLPEPAMCARLAAIHAHDTAPEAVAAHESFDAAPTHVMSFRSERPLDPWAPISPATGLEDRTHLLEEGPVLPLARTHRPCVPRVEPRSRDVEQPTEPRHSERLAFVLDEREDVGFRAEVNRMSFFNNACSSWSSACARCSDWNRFIVRAGGTVTALGTETRPRNIPSRASFRQRDSMNG